MNQIVIEGTTRGKCELCNGKSSKEKDLLVIRGTYSGQVCADHVLILAKQKKD